jgi:putrescine transport system ATP-binding protein
VSATPAGGTRAAPGGPAPRRHYEPWDVPEATPLLRIANASKAFGGVVAVDQVSLDIYPNEFFALLGPSGCGKTTLLRILAGFEQPDSGRVTLDGADLTAVPPYRRPVNMMFQSYALFPHMTVAGNIAFGLRQEGLPGREIRARVAEALALVQLEGFGARKPHQLSGGQKQRVALARSLVKRPKLLLLDEPLGALDRKLREETQFELITIQERVSITFVIVTHDQDEAMTMASRIAVMDRGRIAQVATPGEIYEQPNSRYVATFIGSVNLFEGNLIEADGRRLIQSTEAGCDIALAQLPPLAAGHRLWVAVRPEKLEISRDAAPQPADATNRVSGVVWDIGYLGNLSTYRVKLDSGKLVTATEANRARLTERAITWEDRVTLRWSPQAGVALLT